MVGNLHLPSPSLCIFSSFKPFCLLHREREKNCIISHPPADFPPSLTYYILTLEREFPASLTTSSKGAKKSLNLALDSPSRRLEVATFDRPTAGESLSTTSFKFCESNMPQHHSSVGPAHSESEDAPPQAHTHTCTHMSREMGRRRGAEENYS